MINKDFIDQSKRVLKVAKKPDVEEYITIAKITGLGIIILGLIGVIIFFIFEYLINGLISPWEG